MFRTYFIHNRIVVVKNKKGELAFLLSEASVVQAALDNQNPTVLKRSLVFCSVECMHVLIF